MTRLRGVSVSTPDASPGSAVAAVAAIDKTLFFQSKLPPNVPGVLVQNTIEIRDPSQVLPWHLDERRRRFHLLVRRFVLSAVSEGVSICS